MPRTHDDQIRILVMDANERNARLLSDYLASEGYRPVVATDLETADEELANAERFEFAIVDIDWFEQPVWPYCERLDTCDVPFVVFSGVQTRPIQQKSREKGARAFVHKPIEKRELRDLIRTTIDR